MKLSLRFLLLVLSLVVAVGASALAGTRALRTLDTELRQVVEEDMERLLAITHARRVFRSMTVLERDALLAKSANERAEGRKKMASLGDELGGHLRRYERSRPAEDAATLRDIRAAAQRWRELDARVMSALEQDPGAALALAKEHAKDPVSWEKSIGELVKRSEQRLNQRVKNTHAVYERARSTLFSVSGLTALLAVGFGAVIFLGIRRMVNEVVSLNTNLEGLVQARTLALADRERSLRLVLDSTGDALIGIDKQGNLTGECSAASTAWFGEPRAGLPAGSYLFPDGEELALSFALGMSQLSDGFLPWEVAVDQLPRRIVLGERTLELEYKPVFEGGELARFLLVARDVSARVKHEASERRAREQQAILEKVLADRTGFEHFVRDCERLISSLGTESDLVTAKRDLHTLKGNSAIFGLSSLAECCHAVEDRVAESGELPSAADVATLASLFRARMSSVEGFLSGLARGVLELPEEEHRNLVTALLKRRDHHEILDAVELWTWSRTAERLTQLRAQAEYVAKRFDKEISVKVEHNELRIPPGYLERVWSALGHAVRNAIDHGIEAPEVRASLGKPRAGQLVLRTRVTQDSLVIEIEDDGAGIDREAVLNAARRKGLDERLSPEQLIFLDDLSSRETVTDVSGRGVGLAAVREACDAACGLIQVRSERGQGTSFSFSFPRPIVKVGALAERIEKRWSLVPRVAPGEPEADSGTQPTAAKAVG